MNFFHHKDLGNHLLQLCPKVVKHLVCVCIYIYIYITLRISRHRKEDNIKINLKRGGIGGCETTLSDSGYGQVA